MASIKLSNGVVLPAFGLGTFQLQGDAARVAALAALNAGVRHIDTAQVYRNEEAVGQALVESGLPREEVFITTKVAPLKVTEGEAEAYESVLVSLTKLGTAYADLVLLHWPGASRTKLDDPRILDVRIGAWAALCRLYKEGKARAIGVSNYMPAHLASLEAAAADGRIPHYITPHVNQFELHPLCQQREAVSACASRGIAVVAYSSLARGEARLLEAAPVAAAAAAHGKSPQQVVLKWALQHGWAVIPKSTQPERIVANAVAADAGWALSEAEVAALDGLEEAVGTVRTCWDPTTVLV